jgi:diguanylate cyclase (GGDEF)-like protein
VTDRDRRLQQQAAVAELGREVLATTALDEIIAVCVAAIERVTSAHTCRVVGLAEEVSIDRCETEDTEAVLRVPVGDPADPIANIEVLSDAPIGSADAQVIESIASILLSSIMRNRAEDAIRHQAMHDPLTGLPNRTLFNDRLAHAIARRNRSGGHLAVMIVDLDGFKTVNDSLGHLAGDALLIAVARRFQHALRDLDTVARLGGDEFAIVVELESPEQAGRVAQRVLGALERPLQLADRDVSIGASIGITLAQQLETAPDVLLSNADAAMYRAKREGKGCYRVFETSMHTAAVERMDVEQALRHAITTRALTVHYQPVVNAHSGKVTSFEALARWHDPVRGFVPPDMFIPLAEESGLIVELGRDVLRQACHQAGIWHSDSTGIDVGIAVNVSRLQLVDAHFVGDVRDALSDAGLEASALTLEITESALVGDSGRVVATLDELRRSGARIAIDDFGTGYSSFAALAELPIDILKIDKSFIDKLLSGHDGRGFVYAILNLAQTLRLETIAEGVELSEQRDELRDLGCTHIQGYFFAKPMAAEQATRYLRDHGSIGVDHADAGVPIARDLRSAR